MIKQYFYQTPKFVSDQIHSKKTSVSVSKIFFGSTTIIVSTYLCSQAFTETPVHKSHVDIRRIFSHWEQSNRKSMSLFFEDTISYRNASTLASSTREVIKTTFGERTDSSAKDPWGFETSSLHS
mmetsp:Transcript_32359/g.39819  ORF Transcript_32359/g.39819 Transcript_32359/m.39819 type:complete len:124 (-) Transcript_32359:818-1189(-)